MRPLLVICLSACTLVDPGEETQATSCNGRHQDCVAPTAAITSPLAGATVSGTITISATASDNVGVTRVELLVDGALVATDTSAPYAASWNTTTRANGSHSISAKAYDAAGNVGTSASVVVTISNAATAVATTLFGMHLQNQTYPTVSIGALGKAASVGWCYVERTRGTYSWAVLDSWVDFAATHGVSFFYSNYCVPQWAAKPGATCECLNSSAGCTVTRCAGGVATLQDWRDFVAAMVNHYKNRATGQIHIWELWNEPFLEDTSTLFGMSAADFVPLANAAHDVIRANDPTATIIGPSGHSTDYDTYWGAGMTKDLDVVSFHGYPTASTPTAESLVSLRMTAIKNVMAKYGVSRPIWDTEGSWGTTSLTLDQQIGFVARFLLLHWANGVSRAYWYAWDNASWGHLQGTAAATAYQQTYNWMVGATMPSGCSVGGSVYSCSLTRAGGYQGLAVWNTSGSSSYTPASTYIHYRDLAGVVHAVAAGTPITIGIKPVLLENQ